MHKYRFFPCQCHHPSVYLIRGKLPYPFFPYFIRLSHRNPDIRINNIRASHSRFHIFRQGNRRSRAFCNFFAFLHQLPVRKILFRRTSRKMHPHLSTGYHQGISHIITRIPHISKTDIFQISKMLAYRQQIRQHLRRMELVRQAVPYRNFRILCQFLHDVLPEAAVFDPFIHAGKNSCRIRNAFLLADLRDGRIEIRRSHPQIVCRYFKGTSCPRTRFLKNKRHVLSLMPSCQYSLFLFLLQICRQIQHISYLRRSKIQQL